MARPDSAPPALRWVVLRHEGVERPHFDLLFEDSLGSPLVAFQLDRWPVEQPAAARPLPPHRRRYLDYEGPISGGRGHVRRVAAGACPIRRTAEGWRLDLEPTALVLRPEGEGWSASVSL